MYSAYGGVRLGVAASGSRVSGNASLTLDATFFASASLPE